MIVDDPIILNPPAAVTQLMKLASEAAASIPYYQTSFASVDFSQQDLQLKALPILTKETGRRLQKEMVRLDFLQERADRCLTYTSGSTGIPLCIIRKHTELMRAAKDVWEARKAIFPDILFSRGIWIHNRLPKTPLEHGLNTQTRGKMGMLVETTFDYNPEQFHPYLDELDYLQPRWLTGPPALLALLAQEMRKEKRYPKLPLAFVESHGSLLTEETRTLLMETFGCPVTSMYGCEETQALAYECPKGRLHIFDNIGLVELHPWEIEEEYELVISSLVFKIMPFIRYQVGDIVHYQATQCSCGSSRAVLGKVRGRVTDLIVGTALSGTFVFHTIIKSVIAAFGLDAVLQYQVHQLTTNNFEVHLKLSDPAMLPQVATEFQQEGTRILPNARFAFVLVNQIDPSPVGKIQFFVPHM